MVNLASIRRRRVFFQLLDRRCENPLLRFPPNAAPATSAQDTVKYGFDFSIQVEPYRVDRFSLVIDGRYSLSVTSKPGEDENFVSVLIGMKYFIQGKDQPPP